MTLEFNVIDVIDNHAQPAGFSAVLWQGMLDCT